VSFCRQYYLRASALVLSVIFLRNMAEVGKSKDASADENECTPDSTPASELDADGALPSKTDDTEVVNMPLQNGHSSKKG
jgi:hypothetical protein